MNRLTESINTLLKVYGLNSAVPVSMLDCRVIRPDKLIRCGLNPNSELYAYMICVPYLTPQDKKNISSYAVPRDYHLFFSELFSHLTDSLSHEYPHYSFCGFSDNSPIDERHAAAMAGLGVLGKNGMLITEAYSSYVFIGEIITDYPVTDAVKNDISYCSGCGKCLAACPKGDGICLSELTQKKGELTDDEILRIAQSGCAWGCDICQEVCPHTKAATERGTIYTDVDFFLAGNTPLLSTRQLEAMSDTDFSLRAYSWRKRGTILRNLEIIEKFNGEDK